MANPFTSKTAGPALPTDFGMQQEEILRQKRMADLLEQQSMEPLEGKMVSGIYVAPSWTQQLAKALNPLMARKTREYAGEQEQQLAQQMGEERATTLQKYADLMRGQPQQVMPEGIAGPPVPEVKPDRNAAIAALLKSRDPMLQQMGLQQQMTALEPVKPVVVGRSLLDPTTGKPVGIDQTWQEEQAAARAAKRQELEMRLADQKSAREEQAALRRELASNRPEKLVTVMGPDGEPVSIPQSQAQGMTLWNPSIAKQRKTEAASKEAKTQLSETVAQLKQSYDDLKTSGGITSTKAGTAANIAARLGSSGIGQMVGGAVGTENQARRQSIEQTRPLLMNLIKQATGMSAQQMNSNAEMQLYLKAATDPSLTYEANMDALRNLDKMFGLDINFEKGGRSVGGKIPGQQPSGMPSQSAIEAEIARRRGGK